MIDINLGFLTGPFHVDDPHRPLMKAAPCNCILKTPAADGSERRRLIHDLSVRCGPENSSCNESIKRDDYSPKYEYLSQALDHVIQCGRYSWQAILDIKHAFSNISVNSHDRFFLAFRVGNLLFVSGRLVFGCASSPAIFGDLDQGLVWIVRNSVLGILITAYVDDHHFVRMHKEDLLNDLSVFKSIFHNANVPLEDDKESVSQIVSFLGVVINTVSWSITLKPSTFRTLCVKVDAWLLLTKVSIRDIMKMLGNFLWASIAFMGGGTFSSRLMQSLRMRFANNRFASINIRTTAYVSYIRLDLLWWKAILALPYLHGRPISDLNPPVVEIFTDACPSGIGGWFSIASIAHFYAADTTSWRVLNAHSIFMDDPAWCPTEPRNSAHNNVPAYELLAIVAAVVTWGHRWEGRTLIFRCDNEGMCKVVNRPSRYCSNPDTNGILRQLFYAENLYRVFVHCLWVPREDNQAADWLSRLDIPKFRAFQVSRGIHTCVQHPISWSDIPQFGDLDETLLSINQKLTRRVADNGGAISIVDQTSI
jgi:hypothetical protein